MKKNKKILGLFNKKEYIAIFNYIFFGIMTTFVNIIIYYILTKVGVERVISNLISITLSIIFAYFTNAKYVFLSNSKKMKEIIKELIKFFSSRLITMLIEILGLELFVFIGIEDFNSKIIMQVVVIVGNYIISKYFVFKKEKL